jgi:hypothetical protein
MHSQLTPAAATSLAKWHAMAAQHDLSNLSEIVHPNAVFRSPVAYNDYSSSAKLILIISTVFNVFSNFRYLREFVSEDGLNVALEFKADVGGKEIHGLDLIRMDEQGLIVEFEVAARPISGVMALGEAMKARLAGKI